MHLPPSAPRAAATSRRARQIRAAAARAMIDHRTHVHLYAQVHPDPSRIRALVSSFHRTRRSLARHLPVVAALLFDSIQFQFSSILSPHHFCIISISSALPRRRLMPRPARSHNSSPPRLHVCVTDRVRLVLRAALSPDLLANHTDASLFHSIAALSHHRCEVEFESCDRLNTGDNKRRMTRRKE